MAIMGLFQSSYVSSILTTRTIMKTEIDTVSLQEIIKILKRMYNMSQREDWQESEAQELIMDGGDLYADYFRNNN